MLVLYVAVEEHVVGALSTVPQQWDMGVLPEQWACAELSMHGVLAWLHAEWYWALQDCGAMVLLLATPKLVAGAKPH